MKYIIKKEIANSKLYQRRFLVEKLGFSPACISNIMNRKRSCPKHTAFAITKAINLNANISDFFDEV